MEHTSVSDTAHKFTSKGTVSHCFRAGSDVTYVVMHFSIEHPFLVGHCSRTQTNSIYLCEYNCTNRVGLGTRTGHLLLIHSALEEVLAMPCGIKHLFPVLRLLGFILYMDKYNKL